MTRSATEPRAALLRALLLAVGMSAAVLAVAQSPVKMPVRETPRETAGTEPREKAKGRKSLFGTTHFVYRAEGRRLSDVLQDFAASQGLPAVVADGLEGVVNADFDMRPEMFLQNISRAYNILWYHDGVALYFYPGRMIQSRMIRLKGFNRQQVTKLLQSLDVGDQRYLIRYDEAQSTLFVSGPPRHVELVSDAVESLEAGVMERGVRTVHVFPLRFASAGSRMVGDVQVPGIVDTLKRLYTDSGNGGSEVSESTHELIDKVTNERELQPDPRRGLGQSPAGLARLLPQKRAESTLPSSSYKPRNKGKRPERDDSPPVFVADDGVNAVIVYGRAERMSEYAALIQQLDQKPVLVELEATIIEVVADSVSSLGIDWSLKGARHSVSVSSPLGGESAVGGVFSIGTVLSNAGRELLARVNVLQGEGKARIVSRPSVLGVVNRAAVMREKRIANVRVAGNLEANLFQIEAGTLLQMTPQVTGTDGAQRIKLSIYIEDGNFETNTVDQIPVVKRTEIRTEAHVREGDSLLIGGLTVESDRSGTQGVPGLSRLPLVGALFRNTNAGSERVERLFMITPRLLNAGDPVRQKLGAESLGSPYGASSGINLPVPVPGASADVPGKTGYTERTVLPQPEPTYN